MGDIKDIQEAVEARMILLVSGGGSDKFRASESAFSFDEDPDSITNLAFHINIENIDSEYYAFQLENAVDAMSISIAYKMSAGRKKRSIQKIALDDRETVVNDLINASSISGLGSDPLLTFDRGYVQASEYVGTYLISTLVFTVNYLRDVS